MSQELSQRNPLELLHQAVAAAANGERLPAPVQDWVTGALMHFIEQGQPVNESLGLTGGDRRRYLRWRRDSHLQAAYRLTGDFRAFLTRVKHYHTYKAAHWQKRGLGRQADEFDVHLFGAWATGCMPVSTKTLRRIVNRDMGSVSGVPDAVIKHQPMEDDT